jgi:protocatechuate 3,4-dioxygenase beta subunit
MHDDDTPVGRLLTRREMLALLGMGGLALVAGCSGGSGDGTPQARATGSANTPGRTAPMSAATVPACVGQPALTEGPFFVDAKLNRSDIRTDTASGAASAGVTLALTLLVSSVADACTPLSGALVDLWQCDAAGAYSDAQDPTFDTRGKDFLRGFQATDEDGRARFTTIYPGWYPGRAVHVHFKIRSTAASGAAGEFTSQLFFDDALTDRVHAASPYAAKGNGRLRNEADTFYQESGGLLTLDATPSGDGYEATFHIGMKAPA